MGLFNDKVEIILEGLQKPMYESKTVKEPSLKSESNLKSECCNAEVVLIKNKSFPTAKDYWKCEKCKMNCDVKEPKSVKCDCMKFKAYAILTKGNTVKINTIGVFNNGFLAITFNGEVADDELNEYKDGFAKLVQVEIRVIEDGKKINTGGVSLK